MTDLFVKIMCYTVLPITQLAAHTLPDRDSDDIRRVLKWLLSIGSLVN